MRLEYRHVDLDARDPNGETVRSGTGYDGGNRSSSNVYPVHDFSVRCEIEVVEAKPGATLALRLFDGTDAVAAEVSVGPRADGKVSLSHDKQGGLAAARGVALEPGRTHAVEVRTTTPGLVVRARRSYVAARKLPAPCVGITGANCR